MYISVEALSIPPAPSALSQLTKNCLFIPFFKYPMISYVQKESKTEFRCKL
jgi:hypothetical protein